MQDQKKFEDREELEPEDADTEPLVNSGFEAEEADPEFDDSTNGAKG